MKLLAFSDLHRDKQRARQLVERSREAELVVGAGDFGSFRLGLTGAIDQLRSIDKPSLLVPGNNESDTALWRACADWTNARVLHGEAAEIDGVRFFGLGAGIPTTPFPWSFDLTEEEAAAQLQSCPDGAVLIVHSPPKGHLDEVRGRHYGSQAILDTIEAKQPSLVLCGHIHHCWGSETMIGHSRVVNLGPDGMLFEV
jgi:Icc-related predicted phosphoesterase